MQRWPQAQPEGIGPDLGWWSPPLALGPIGLYALAVLLLSTQPFFELILSRPDWRLLTGFLWASAFAAGLALALRNARPTSLASSLRGLPCLWLVLLILVLSCAWSLDPTWSLYIAGWVVGTTLVGVVLGSLLSPRRLMRVLFWPFALVPIGSLIVELLDLGQGLQRWSGTTPNPNFLGPITASAATYFLIALLHRRLAAPIALPLCLLAVLVTLMTLSATSIVMLLTGAGVVLSFWVSRRLRLGGDLGTVLIALGLVGLGAVGLVRWEDTTRILGKDTSATQRTEAWAEAIQIVAYRPLSGFGLGVVYGMGERTYFPEFRSTGGLFHAHNGYLHLATAAGLPAAGLALVGLLRALARALAEFARSASAFALFSSSYLLMFLIGNLTEARIFMEGSFDWLLAVTLAAALARIRTARSERRPRPRPTAASALPS